MESMSGGCDRQERYLLTWTLQMVSILKRRDGMDLDGEDDGGAGGEVDIEVQAATHDETVSYASWMKVGKRA